jgi:unsaturated chondroitin disaccharide hydrolase
MIPSKVEPNAADLLPGIERLWRLSAAKILEIEKAWPADAASPVYTVEGKYTTRGWTEWTRGFQYGSAILQFEATGEEAFLEIGRRGTTAAMAPHLTHFGVHDHGFNTVSTYGNLRRLILGGRCEAGAGELDFHELAIRCSGAVQARRWTTTHDGGGFIHSFNGPHSLFADTIRSLRVLALAHSLGHTLLDENDEKVSLLGRLIAHARSTARYTIYQGEGRDHYDIRGRVAHESLFDTVDGNYRCPSTQQGYSPFSTWTRGLAWVLLGFAEELEFFETLSDEEFEPYGGRSAILETSIGAARAAADFYLEQTPSDGIPYWDTGAPGLFRLTGWRDHPADPFNDCEPVDSSAAVIAAQGFLRLALHLSRAGDSAAAERYRHAGLSITERLLEGPYLSSDENHEGLILHSIYHRPRGWDHVPAGRKIPCGESSMWGDYHARELALLVQQLAAGGAYWTFFGEREAGGAR